MLSLIIIFTNNIKGQNYKYNVKCIYKLEFQVDSTEPKSRRSEEMLLFLCDNYSVFKSKNNCRNDSSAQKPNNINNTGKIVFSNMASTATYFRFTIIKDSVNLLKYSDFIDIDRYEYSEPKNTINWLISDDTATVSGFHCQKAYAMYGGRKWEAWFSSEIAVSEGPYKFNGLPGLIIKISDSQEYFSFLLTEIINRPGIVYGSLKEINKISKSKFYNTLKYYKNNQLEIMQQNGLKITGGEDAIRERISARLKANNNEIERIIN